MQLGLANWVKGVTTSTWNKFSSRDNLQRAAISSMILSWFCLITVEESTTNKDMTFKCTTPKNLSEKWDFKHFEQSVIHQCNHTIYTFMSNRFVSPFVHTIIKWLGYLIDLSSDEGQITSRSVCNAMNNYARISKMFTNAQTKYSHRLWNWSPLF